MRSRDRRVLIVLDNFEQIVEAAPTLVGLYSAAPLARFLVTSRIVLRIRGEHVYEVERLTTPPGACRRASTAPRDRRRSRCS